jgi:hypothetical protein
MRRLFALACAAWFLGAAALMGDGRFGTSGDPPNEEVIGDPTVMAVYFVARLLFVGLALMALGLVDWTSFGDRDPS